ncbi:hypothetical protein GQX74_009568 [Glossina fuscipes]|nr:hypothetical protein GQX74_009568 [Glossina fuscipes]
MSSRNLDHEVFISDSEDDAYLKANVIGLVFTNTNESPQPYEPNCLGDNKMPDKNKKTAQHACFTARDCVKLSSLWHFTLVSPYAARMIKCCLYTRPTQWLMLRLVGAEM